jgi:hypothetical protein
MEDVLARKIYSVRTKSFQVEVLRWDWISQTMRRDVLSIAYYIYIVWLMYGHVSSTNIALM